MTLGKRGRPKKHRYPEIFADLDDPPEDDPLEACLWGQRIAVKALKETVQGRHNRELNAEIKSLLRIIIACVPMERIAGAEKKITVAQKARQRPERVTGPDVERVNGPGSPATRGRRTIRG